MAGPITDFGCSRLTAPDTCPSSVTDGDPNRWHPDPGRSAPIATASPCRREPHPRWNILSLETRTEYLLPTGNGSVTNGPARSPLEHYAVTIAADGSITVDSGQTVSASTDPCARRVICRSVVCSFRSPAAMPVPATVANAPSRQKVTLRPRVRAPSRAEAKKVMEEMVKQAKGNGQKFTCDGCHKDLDSYELTKNATDDFRKLEATATMK